MADHNKLTLNVHVPNGDGTRERTLSIRTNGQISWAAVTIVLQEKLKIGNKSWAFQYFDDEDDVIFGRTEMEWTEAMETAVKNQGGRDVMNIIAFPLPPQCSPKESKCSSPDNSCGVSNPCGVGNPCEARQPCAGESQDCCDFMRPLPEELPDNGVPLGPKIVNPTLDQYKYSGESLRAVALPLGPIGGGSIAVAGDGGLRQWQISNSVNHTAHVPDSFFAVRVDQGGNSNSVVLQSSTWYDQTGFKPAAYVTDHVVPQASKDLLSVLPGVKTLEITAKYPTAEVDYLSEEVPVKIHLEAFNPCIFLSSMDSGIPVIIFNFTVTNTLSAAVKVSFLGSLLNIAGWNGQTSIVNEVSTPGFGGNLNSLFHTSNMFGIDMNNPSLPEKSSFNGHVAISVLTKDGDKLTTMLQYNSVKEMWDDFTGNGLPGQGSPGPSPAGSSWAGAISCGREIQPNSSETFTFFLAWHFPHRYVNWSQSYLGIPSNDSQYYIGNYYSSKWKDVREVLQYTAVQLDDLSKDTISLRDGLFNSKLPWQLIDSVAGRLSVVRSPTYMWLGDGRLYAFEGCSATSGCCPLNCTHVLNYEMTVARIFPDLERTMRDIDLKEQITPHGAVPSRTIAPLLLRRIWTFWKNYDPEPNSLKNCTDGEIGTVLKTYREVLQQAPSDWFASTWPAVQKIMSRWMDKLDDGTGLIRGAQPNTYDDVLYGVNVFTGSLYLSALRAAEEMAKLQKDTALAQKYRERFNSGSPKLDELCFTNNSYYTQPSTEDQLSGVVSDATFVDCLVGQWWAHALNLGYVLPEDHVKSTLQAIYKANHTDAFDPAVQSPRKFFDQRDAGMYICKWPGAVPKGALRYHSEGAWTGLEYEFAALCFYNGMPDTALKVLEEARYKYDGTRRSPWNEIECGDHYCRPMSSWLLFDAISGQRWSFADPERSTLVLGFGPRWNPTDFSSFFILGTCWGQFAQAGDDQLQNGTAKLVIKYGKLHLAQFQLHTSRATSAFVSVNEDAKPLSITASQGDVGLRIVFPSSGLLLNRGDTLHVKFYG